MGISTVVPWLIALAVHIGLDFAIDTVNPTPGLGGASILWYLGFPLTRNG